MARKQSNSSPIFIIFAALLIVGLYWACTTWQNQPQQKPDYTASTQSVSDDKIIFGGTPRPAPGAGDETAFEVIKNQAYIVGYSESRRDPLWAAYRVFHTDHPYSFPRPATFSTDPRTTAKVKQSDFTGSGYDRGHMAPNSAIVHDFGKDAQLETFFLSNICPQSPALNEHVWERLEVHEREYADKYEEVWVIDGPIFSDLNGGTTDRLKSGIAVPTAFYKIIIDEEGHPGGKPRVFSVIMPQNVKGTELPQEFLTSVSEIEKETHLNFFWTLDAATRVELESKVYKMW